MKNAMLKRLGCVIAAALAIPFAALAANPVAVWDGNFTVAQPGYTLDLNGNQLSQDNATITINQNVGVTVTSEGTFSSGFTVLFRYSNLDLSLSARQVLAATKLTDTENRTGAEINGDGLSCGIWNGGSWNSSGTYNAMTSEQTAGVFAYAHYSTTSYSGTGTQLYCLINGARNTIVNAGGLGSRDDTAKYKGASVGGPTASISGASAATGMKITGIAIFDGILTEAEMTGYIWPSEIQTISVTANTSVSAINAQYDSTTYKAAKVTVASGVTITVDAAFDPTIRSVSSVGSVTLSAASQPASSYFAHVDFSGVQGALFRSWLTPGVVGFNFTSEYGTDVSGALATADNWIHDNNSANGTSTAMFADGLSTLKWSSANTWACSGSTIISGYLDDGANGGNGATVTLSGVPYETYDVIVYCSSDSDPGQFLAKTVNGTTYTWDSTAGAVVVGNSVWGKAALSTPVYGVNALRIKNLSGPLTIYGTARNGSNRGGIAAFQIMPPNTPDNIRTYTLTLNGTATTWSDGTWTLNGQTVDAPTSGYVEIVASASTVLTVNQAVSLTDLKVRGGENVVVTVAAGSSGSISAVKATVKGGVLKRGSASVLGATPSIVVEDGGTFDMNGMAVDATTAFTIAGAGAGSWPWAITSSSSGDAQITIAPILAADATIGGANKIILGADQAVTLFPLGGFTLKKIGEGELYCYNVRTDNGTIDIVGGTVSFNQWTALDGYETIDRHTTVIVRNGATIANNAGRRLWVDTLDVRGGTVFTTANGYFGVSSVLTGACETVYLQFNNGAIAALSGNLTTETMECESASFTKVDAAAPVAVTPGVLTVSGSITVGAGVTFNLGTNRPEGVLTIDDNGTLTVAKANASDAPMLRVSAQPASIVLYDENGNAVDSPYVAYDSENGTITIVGGGNIWTGASGTWSSGQFDGRAVSTEGSDVSFGQGTTPQSAVTVTVNGAKSVNTASFIASATAYTLTGDKITTAGGLTVGGKAPVVISNTIGGTVTINSGSELTLAGTEAGLQSGSLTGPGTLVLDPGAGNTYTMSTANTNFTGEAIVKSGTVYMGDATAFGPLNKANGIRVKGGAVLSSRDVTCGEGWGYVDTAYKNKAILEEGATLVPWRNNDYKLGAFSALALEGNATVDATDCDTGLSLHYNYNWAHLALDTNTLTKIGNGDFYISAPKITGAGKINVTAGTITICSSYFASRPGSFTDGTLEIAAGAGLRFIDYTGANTGGGSLTVKNLILNGDVTRQSPTYSTLTVTGYITGIGTTPMLMLAEGAVFKPTGKGYLKITESLTLPEDGKLKVDISDVDFTSGRSVPLFKVGSASMLPEPGNIELTGGTLPDDGWVLAKTADGRGYKLLNRNKQLRLILR